MRDKIEVINTTHIGLGKLWMNFWIYISLPVGAAIIAILGVLNLVVGLSSPGEIASHGEFFIYPLSVILLIIAGFQVSVAVGLARRRMWAFRDNLFLIFVTSLSFFGPFIQELGEPSHIVRQEQKAILFVVGLVFAIVWVAPNWIYWRKRQKWFVD